MAKGLFDLQGKVTVVTGGNSGIGLGFARGIAKQGGDLAIWARSKEKNAAARQELESFGVRVTTRQVDGSIACSRIPAWALCRESTRFSTCPPRSITSSST